MHDILQILGLRDYKGGGGAQRRAEEYKEKFERFRVKEWRTYGTRMETDAGRSENTTMDKRMEKKNTRTKCNINLGRSENREGKD